MGCGRKVILQTVPPEPTDEGEEAAPCLRPKERINEPGKPMSRKEMYSLLLTQQGMKCQGCNRAFDDPRYLELDHNVPVQTEGQITSPTESGFLVRAIG